MLFKTFNRIDFECYKTELDYIISVISKNTRIASNFRVCDVLKKFWRRIAMRILDYPWNYCTKHYLYMESMK